jgi:hypothetical protein
MAVRRASPHVPAEEVWVDFWLTLTRVITHRAKAFGYFDEPSPTFLRPLAETENASLLKIIEKLHTSAPPVIDAAGVRSVGSNSRAAVSSILM